MTDPLQAQVQKAVAGQYAIVRLLGRGGMGAVYLARDQELDRLVALKVLPPEADDSAERRARFRREAQLAAKLTHPSIVPLHSFGESDGLMYYAMGYVRGESLADRLRREGRIPQEETRQKLAQLAEALGYAHSKGVVHRDIKPDNILLDDESGQPLLADFGIARTVGPSGTKAEAGSVVGTVHYMSPEQAIGAASIDGRSDLYALGVVGYVMLAGRTPFDARTFQEFVAEQAGSDAPSLVSRVPDIAADLASTLMRCLSRDAAARWPDARAFKQSLGAAMEDDSERLPGELREIASAWFYSLFGGWVIANLVLLLAPASVAPGSAIFMGFVPAMAYAQAAFFHVRRGFSWAEMRRVALWPPEWWAFWWPLSWRRPGDLWNRLPLTVRRVRLVYGVLASALLLSWPLLFRPATRLAFLLGFGLAWLVMTATMVFCAWWAHRSSIPNNADLRSLFMRSTADRRFWKRPQMAKRLLPVGTTSGNGTPTTPAECVRQIVEATQSITGPARDPGLKAAEVARLAFGALEALDREILQNGGDTEAVAKRAHVAKGLDTLWREHVRVIREDTDAAVQGLTESARALERDLEGHGLAAASADVTGVTRANADEIARTR